MTKKGFLLLILMALVVLVPLIFFYYSTFALSVPKTYTAPVSDASKKNKNFNSIAVNKTLHLVLLKDKVYHYNGSQGTEGAFINYNDLRTIITNEKGEWKERFLVLIKPSESASYQSTVNVLDEMTINNITNFSLEQPSPSEIKFLQINQE